MYIAQKQQGIAKSFKTQKMPRIQHTKVASAARRPSKIDGGGAGKLSAAWRAQGSGSGLIRGVDSGYR